MTPTKIMERMFQVEGAARAKTVRVARLRACEDAKQGDSRGRKVGRWAEAV